MNPEIWNAILMTLTVLGVATFWVIIVLILSVWVIRGRKS